MCTVMFRAPSMDRPRDLMNCAVMVFLSRRSKLFIISACFLVMILLGMADELMCEVERRGKDGVEYLDHTAPGSERQPAGSPAAP